MDSEAVMRLSTKGRVAVTAMMELAIRRQVTLRELLASQGISVSYIEQILARLRRQGLVQGIRGPGGGYRLARFASEITVAEIITSAEEPLSGTYAGEQGTEADEENDLTYDLWRRLSGKIYDFLNGITLAQCVEQPRPQAVEGRRGRQHERKWSDT